MPHLISAYPPAPSTGGRHECASSNGGLVGRAGRCLQAGDPVRLLRRLQLQPYLLRDAFARSSGLKRQLFGVVHRAGYAGVRACDFGER